MHGLTTRAVRMRIGQARRLSTHWVFQSMIYMDPTERWFKLGLDAAGTALAFVAIRKALAYPQSVAVAFLIAHTVNFLLNGQVHVALKWPGRHAREVAELNTYLDGVAGRVCRSASVSEVYLFGSAVRNEIRSSSDLDVRVMRRRGLRNGIVSCLLVAAERSRALVARIPLDIYVWDSRSRPMREDEVPVFLCQPPEAVDARRGYRASRIQGQ